MRIINVTTDIDSQKLISLNGILPVEEMIKSEVHDTTRIEAKEEKTAQETQKKGRKAKRVSTEEV